MNLRPASTAAPEFKADQPAVAAFEICVGAAFHFACHSSLGEITFVTLGCLARY